MISATVAALIAGIPTILGIIATIVAWKFNPRRQMYADLDAIFKQQEELYAKRDKALETNDNNTLTAVVADLILLRARKNTLLQRIGAGAV